MTKLKVNVPPVEDLEEYEQEFGLEALIMKYSCYEYLIGREDSIDFLHKKYFEYKEKKENNEQ